MGDGSDREARVTGEQPSSPAVAKSGGKPSSPPTGIGHWLADHLKPFSMAGAVLLVLFGAQRMGIHVSQISTNGVQLASVIAVTKETASSANDLGARVAELKDRASSLEARIALLESAPLSTDATVPGAAKVELAKLADERFEQEQQVEDVPPVIQTAPLAQLALDAPPAKTPERSSFVGHIWLGDRDREDTSWVRIRIDPSPAGKASAIPVGATFRVKGNMVARDGAPEDSARYYLASGRKGMIASRSLVRIRSAPRLYTRNNRVQVWAEVEVVEPATSN